jgi:putative transposase
MPEGEFEIYRRHLPHWREGGAVYFVTFNLSPEQPALREQERDLVMSIMLGEQNKRYHLWAWVVMDDHVHSVVALSEDITLSQVLHTWKSFSAHQLQRKFARTGQVWQHESFDRIIRDENELYQKCNYIVTNPMRRWPEICEYKWCGYDFP